MSNSRSITSEKKITDSIQLLQHFKEHEEAYLTTSLFLAKHFNLDHEYVVGLVKSLASQEKFKVSLPEKFVSWQLTEEGHEYAEKGSPEAYVAKLLQNSPDGLALPDVLRETEKFNRETMEIGLRVVLKEKWATMDKATKRLFYNKIGASPQDRTKDWLLIIKDADERNASEEELLQSMVEKINKPKEKLMSDVIQELKRRKLIALKTLKYYLVERGKYFSTQLSELATDLTKEMILKGTWKTFEFKPYNFYAPGYHLSRGSIHPLQRTAQRFRRALLNMGFEEMDTSNWVESSFWNFDALFQPQQHPSRDMHDTFFLKNPAHSTLKDIPGDYIDSVKQVHEEGGFGSFGWRYKWSADEAKKNVLRTHTTACSARTLFRLAQHYKEIGRIEPKRYFSIDRVFRNETLDATHLAEFHQVEGLICDRDLSLAHLLGVLKTFYALIGITRLRFKPAYNPYTEPSVEIFGHHPTLNRWIEVGNSGLFRPEMLRPMNFPENVRVIAWGLSLERPTMIQYKINNIRDLFGHHAVLGIA